MTLPKVTKPNDDEDRDFASASDGEASPLLPPDFPDQGENGNGDGRQMKRPSSPPSPPSHTHRKALVIAIVLVTVFFIELAVVILQAPSNALMEDIICREFLSLAPSTSTWNPLAALQGDPRCKVPEVQGRLAMMRGWQSAFDILPSMLCAVPYGLLADRVGRKPVMILAFAGLLLQIFWQIAVLVLSSNGIVPLWTIYLSSLWTFIGAFSCIGPAMVFTTLGDIAEPAERVAVFFQLNVAFMVGELVGGPLAGALMAIAGPWMPLAVSVVSSLISFALITFVPETLDRAIIDHQAIGRSSQSSSPPLQSTLASARILVAASFRELWTFIAANTNLMVLMLPMIFFVLGRTVQDALLQYATKRYDLSWSSATYLVSVRSIVNIVLFVAVFPYASHVLTKTFRMPAKSKDLLMARWTGAVGAAGAFFIALSTGPILFAFSLVFFAFGSGFSSVLRSLLSTLVEQRHLAIVNSLVSYFDLVGALVAGPVLSKALSVGIEIGGFWVGLPFFTAGISLSLSTGLVWMYRLPPMVGREAREE